MNTKTQERPIALLMLLIPLVAGDALAAGRPSAACGVGEYRIHDLGRVGDRANAYIMNARGLNERGQVVGWGNDGGPYDFQDDTAFAWSARSGLQVLPDLAGAAMSVAVALNDRGQAVGLYSEPGGPPRAFVWEAGVMEELTDGEGYTVALSINNRGMVVGSAGVGHAGGDAALWSAGGRVQLADLLPAGSGWVLLEADCINDAGVITGMGLLNGFPRVFIMTPRG